MLTEIHLVMEKKTSDMFTREIVKHYGTSKVSLQKVEKQEKVIYHSKIILFIRPKIKIIKSL